MSVMTGRGGCASVTRTTFLAAGRKVTFPFFVNYLVVRNKGAAAAKVFFTEADHTADNDNYVDIPVASTTYPYGEWAGPVETGAGERDGIWIRGATTLEIVAFQRRG
jgi:hypothetical protein